MDRRPGRPRALSLDLIAQAALDEGIATFSMPTVGRRLGVAHSGLYRYVEDREELLAAAIDLAVRSVGWQQPAGDWREVLTSLDASVWSLCRAYPGFDRAAITLGRSTPTVTDLTRAHVEALVNQGFHVEDAAVAVDFVVGLVLTSSMRSSTESQRDPSVVDDPLLKPFDSEEAWDGHAWHDRKLRIVLDGLAPLVGQR